MDLIKQNLPAGETLEVRFDGGYFTDAADLAKLSDEETKNLRLHTADIEVTLSETQAIAVGQRERTEEIARLWARTRQLGDYEEKSRTADRFRHSAYTAGALMIILVGVSFFIEGLGTGLGAAITTGITIVLAAIGVVGLGGAIILTNRMPYPYSVRVEPMTRAAFNAQNSVNKWPKAAVFVSIGSAIIAIAAIIAPLVFGGGD